MSNKISSLSSFKERKEKTKLAKVTKEFKESLLKTEDVVFNIRQGIKYCDLAKKLCINLIQSYMKDGLSLYKANREASKRINVSVPSLYSFVKEYGAHGNVESTSKLKESKDFFDKMSDYQKDILRNVMNDELRKSSIKKKQTANISSSSNSTTKKHQFFTLNSVFNIIKETGEFPNMSKTTLWKAVRRLGFKYHDSKDSSEEGSWEITHEIAKTVENISEHIAEEVTENFSEKAAKIAVEQAAKIAVGELY